MKRSLGLILMLAMVFTGCNEPKESMNNENISSNQVVEEKDDTGTGKLISDDGVTKDEDISSNQVTENEDINSNQAKEDEEASNDEVDTKQDTSNDVVPENENTSNAEVEASKDVIIDEVTTEDDEISNYSNYKYIKDMGELLWKRDDNRDNVDQVLEEVLEGIFEKGKPSEKVKLSITYFKDDVSNSQSIVKLIYDNEIYQIQGYTNILNIYMVDIDVDDDYRELYVDCSGYSADRNGEMFRIIDGKLIHLGSIEKSVQCDGKGHFVSENYVIKFTDEPLIGAAYYLEDNTIKMKNLIDEEKELVVDPDKKKLVVDEEEEQLLVNQGKVAVAFRSDEEGYDRDWLVWLKKGDILKVYSIDEENSDWKVELNGEKGRMHLQVAG